MGRFVFPRRNVLCKSGTEMKQTAAVQPPIIRPGASKQGWIGQKVAIWAACKWNHFILRVVISCAKPALMMRSDDVSGEDLCFTITSPAFVFMLHSSMFVNYRNQCLFPVAHTTIAKVKEKKQQQKTVVCFKAFVPLQGR